MARMITPLPPAGGESGALSIAGGVAVLSSQGQGVARGHAHLPAAASGRLRTGCVYEEQYDQTYTILVTRQRPHDVPERATHEWWPLLAPSLQLVRTPRGPNSAQMPWALFAARYWAELAALPLSTQNGYIVRLGQALRRAPSVTLLSCERSRGRPELEVRSQRRVLVAWMLGAATWQGAGVNVVLGTDGTPDTRVCTSALDDWVAS